MLVLKSSDSNKIYLLLTALGHFYSGNLKQFLDIVWSHVGSGFLVASPCDWPVV